MEKNTPILFCQNFHEDKIELEDKVTREEKGDPYKAIADYWTTVTKLPRSFHEDYIGCAG